METNCCLSDRYELNQESAEPVSPRWVERRLRSMGWEMVSKAAERSNRTRILMRPTSAAMRRSFVIFNSAVSVLWWAL